MYSTTSYTADHRTLIISKSTGFCCGCNSEEFDSRPVRDTSNEQHSRPRYSSGDASSTHRQWLQGLFVCGQAASKTSCTASYFALAWDAGHLEAHGSYSFARFDRAVNFRYVTYIEPFAITINVGHCEVEIRLSSKQGEGLNFVPRRLFYGKRYLSHLVTSLSHSIQPPCYLRVCVYTLTR